VACGECWESAIRDDERFVVENDLPRKVGDQDDGVDEVAVERAVAGEPMQLTRQEQRIAIAALLRHGKTPAYISRVLRMNHSTVLREVQNLARTAA
jgi:DNA-binding NarL/FixJ family response regulator